MANAIKKVRRADGGHTLPIILLHHGQEQRIALSLLNRLPGRDITREGEPNSGCTAGGLYPEGRLSTGGRCGRAAADRHVVELVCWHLVVRRLCSLLLFLLEPGRKDKCIFVILLVVFVLVIRQFIHIAVPTAHVRRQGWRWDVDSCRCRLFGPLFTLDGQRP